MLYVETRQAISANEAKGMDTTALRANFHGEGLFQDGQIRLL